jgi:phospholipid transport system transporter-binding protein
VEPPAGEAAVPSTVGLPERLTLQESVQELTRLDRALKLQPGPVVSLDASALRVFDTSAVSVLLELRKRLKAQGKTLAVTQWPKRLLDLVGLYGVSDLLPA